MRDKKIINWGIIGPGKIAKRFADGIQDSRFNRLLGIASKNKSRRKKFKDNYSINNKYVFDNYKQILKCKDIDAVYISLTNNLHKKWVLESLKAKKHTLVEKPFVLNVEEGKEIKKILKNNNYYFMEGLMYRFHPQYKILKKLLNNKVIGNIIKIESSFGYKDNDTKKLPRLYDKKLGGGCIYDIGIYPISFSSFVNKILINKKNEIKIIKSKGIIKKNGVEVEAIGTFLLNNKLKLNLRCSFIKKLKNTCTLIGENGKIIIKDPWTPGKNGGYHETSIIVKKNLYEKIYLTKSNKHLFSFEIDYFYNKIFQNYNKNKFPYVSFDESFENLNFLNIWKKSL